MYLMFADEADQDGSKEFLVFASVFIPAERALNIHRKVEQIRKETGFEANDELKASPRTKPTNVSRKTHTLVKNRVLDLAADEGCKICCYVVPHSIAKGQQHSDRLKFGVNTILVKFDQFLRENGNVGGLVFFDQTTDFDQHTYFKEVFAKGLKFSAGRKKLECVVSMSQTQTGLSHLSSVTDIIVGSFRFIINEPDKDQVGRLLTKSLARIMWGTVGTDGRNHVRDRGLCIRPKNVELTSYKADIDALISRLASYTSD